jgi:hypothetical protein
VDDGRFRLLLGGLFAGLAIVSFLVVTLVLESDDDEPAATTTTSTSTSTTATTAPGTLTTPTFVAVVVSEPDEATARSTADELTESGFDSGVLHSDDYSSLNPGFWVTYVGPYDDVAAAQGAVGELAAAGYTAAYPRCIGTSEECA